MTRLRCLSPPFWECRASSCLSHRYGAIQRARPQHLAASPSWSILGAVPLDTGHASAVTIAAPLRIDGPDFFGCQYPRVFRADGHKAHLALQNVRCWLTAFGERTNSIVSGIAHWFHPWGLWFTTFSSSASPVRSHVTACGGQRGRLE